jgi:ABC-type transport system involved in multi-copper enzyme maturation permease subunit/regulation of enolase protein 1 (concanavalin A-like superfamily)
VIALLHAEWTKLRTVPGWVAGLTVAAAVIIGLGVMPGMSGSCGQRGPGSECVLPVGPGGEQVADNFFFVHRPMAGDGTLTVRVSSLTGVVSDGPGTDRPELVPWAKAGLIIKDGTKAGATYAAVMLTGSHGVRMQYDFTHDVAGPSGARWLRLTRAGDTITTYASADGAAWTRVGATRLPGLPATAEAGLFVTAPQYFEEVHQGALSGASGGPSLATAVFDRVSSDDQVSPDGGWTGEAIGGPGDGPFETGYQQTGGQITVRGSGDIAPAVPGAAGIGTTITQTLAGTFGGLIAVIIVGALFITGEYRLGLIRTTLAASTRRGRVLAAKALVLGGAAFVAGLIGAAIVVEFGQRVLRDNGVYVFPASGWTELRLVLGTAAVMAVTAVLALAVGTVFRRSTATVAAALVVIVLPYLLAMSVLPDAAGSWVLRVTPAAAFAVQQSVTEYPQVANLYLPNEGYFPLPPWGGFAVLCVWAAVALAAAAVLIRRRDA